MKTKDIVSPGDRFGRWTIIKESARVISPNGVKLRAFLLFDLDMKAPDKIYIQTNAGEAFSSKWTTIPFRDFENTEYIRKDALIEWAKESMDSIGRLSYGEFVDKLNSM